MDALAIVLVQSELLELGQSESALSVLPCLKQSGLFNNLLASQEWAYNKQLELCNKFQWAQLSEVLAVVLPSSVVAVSLVLVPQSIQVLEALLLFSRASVRSVEPGSSAV